MPEPGPHPQVWVRFCLRYRNPDPYPYPRIPVSGNTQCYPYPCHALTMTQPCSHNWEPGWCTRVTCGQHVWFVQNHMTTRCVQWNGVAVDKVKWVWSMNEDNYGGGGWARQDKSVHMNNKWRTKETLFAPKSVFLRASFVCSYVHFCGTLSLRTQNEWMNNGNNWPPCHWYRSWYGSIMVWCNLLGAEVTKSHKSVHMNKQMNARRKRFWREKAFPSCVICLFMCTLLSLSCPPTPTVIVPHSLIKPLDFVNRNPVPLTHLVVHVILNNQTCWPHVTRVHHPEFSVMRTRLCHG